MPRIAHREIAGYDAPPSRSGKVDATRRHLGALALASVLAALPAGRLAAQSILDSPAPAAKPAGPVPSAPGQAAAAAAKPGEDKGPSIPRGFRGIELGMGRDEVVAALKKDPVYAFRGPEDVTLLPSPNQSLIDVSGLSFVKRAFFQFYDGKLWVMILTLNPDKIDHYSIYTSLAAKYGEPGLLDPKEARWEDGETRVALERPLSLRYMDLKAYADLLGKSEAKEGVVELEREEFLGGL